MNNTQQKTQLSSQTKVQERNAFLASFVSLKKRFLFFISTMNILIPSTIYFICCIMFYNLSRDGKNAISEATEETYLDRFGHEQTIDKSFARLSSRAVAVLFIIGFVYFYYFFLLGKMQLKENTAFHIFNIINFAILTVWYLVYFCDKTKVKTYFIKNLIGNYGWFQNLGDGKRFLLLNLHSAFIGIILDVLPGIYLALFWSYIGKIYRFDSSIKEEEKANNFDFFTKVSSWSSLAQGIVTLPIILLLFFGIATSGKILSFAYPGIFVTCIFMSIIRYTIDKRYGADLYPESEIKGDFSSMSIKNLFSIAFENDIIFYAFIGNLMYFAINSLIELVYQSAITVQAINEARNTSGLFSGMTAGVSESMAQKNFKYFMSQMASISTALISIIYVNFIQERVSGFTSNLKRVCKAAFISISVTCFPLFTIACYYSYSFTKYLDDNMIDDRTKVSAATWAEKENMSFWIIIALGFVAMSISRVSKYMFLDPIRYRIITSLDTPKEREMGKAVIDIYTPRISKGVGTLLLNTVALEMLDEKRCAEKELAIFGTPVFLIASFYMLFPWIWSMNNMCNEHNRKTKSKDKISG